MTLSQAMRVQADPARFVELIDTDPSSDECAPSARALGFDPNGTFTAIVFECATAPDDAATALASLLDARGATACAAHYGDRCVLVVQGIGAGELDAAVTSILSPAATGIGLECARLGGARSSLIQAQQALELAMHRGGISRFEQDWLAAIIVAQRSAVEPLFARGVDLALASPHLADAVRVYAESEFSIAEGARRLRISQTSLRYRLTRWQKLTGWNPWSTDGMSRSLMALELAGCPADVQEPFGPKRF